MIKVKIKKIPKARTGYQVDGALVNDVPAMGGADYNAYIGKPKLRESKYITAVPRDEANLEAEGGETVYGDINGDGMPEHQIIKGPRHHSGGVPLNLPDDTFIFSDTKGMKIKDPEILDMFGKAGTNKAYTPAELAKQYDIQKYRKILEDPDSDKLDRETAELMIKKFVVKLGCLALAQEAKKGFPQGIPAVAKPCMEAKGITEEQIIPKKEILDLKGQVEAKYKQQENADETMQDEYSDEQAAEAQELNQGQPVAQPQEQMQQPSPEGMMMHGGYPHRRLRRAEAGMEQVPPEMMGQEQGGDDMMQIVQEVGAALQQGAKPQEVVMSLLQNELPPEVIVQIFTQLGIPQEQAVGLIQQVIQQMQGGQEQVQQGQPMSEEEAMMMQQQAPPMAQYGMSMGGYDMPFYDEPEYEEEIPEAEYGMPMGAGVSRNYQGHRPLPKAGDGWTIKRSDYKTDAEYDKAIWDANSARELLKKDGKAEGNDPINVIGADGKPLTFTGYSRNAPTDTGNLDLNKWGNTDQSKTAAAQYYMLQQSLGDLNSPVAQKLCDETKKVLGNEAHFRSKSNPNTPSRNWTQRGYAIPGDCKTIINSFLKYQERNLMLEAKGIDGALYKDTGRGLAPWNDYTSPSGKPILGVASLIANGQTVRDPRDPTGKTFITSKAQLLEVQKYMKQTYGSNVSDASAKLGVPFDVNGQDRALGQATFHGYTKMIENSQNGVYSPDDVYNIRNFIGNMQSGVADEAGMTAAFPGLSGINISPVDDFYSVPNSIYGNTAMAGKAAALPYTPTFADPNPEPCQCEDPNNTATYGRLDPATNKCNPDLCKEPPPAENPCPCATVDEAGNTIESTLPRNADGTCPPCEKEEDLDIPGPPAAWWLQDTIKTTGAFGDLMGVKKYMPWAPSVELQKPRPTFMDPTRELAANAEQANIQTQGMAQFAGPQALSARSASVQGQAAKNAADILSKYNNANVNIANQFELKGTDVANQENMLKQANNQRLYDQNTVANQQFDNAKLAMRNNLRNYYTNAITNRWQTDALNQMYPNYQVDPSVGGRMDFIPTEKTPNPNAGTTTNPWQTAYDNCKKNNPGMSEALLRDCAKSSTGTTTTSTSGANSQTGMGMYRGIRKKGGDANHPGYIYINSWLPFID